MPTATDSYRPSLSHEVCRWLYTAMLALAVPFAFLKLAYKAIAGSQGGGTSERARFGICPAPAQQGGYLFHCVSVGEVVAASCMIKQIMAQEPEAAITVTTTTATGSARVRAIFADQVHHFYLPFDLPVTMAAMIRRVKPKAVLITEVELWPNFIHVCWQRRIPVFVINARMTDRSARSYRKLTALFVPMLEKITHVCAQGERDFENYRSLGIHADKLTLTNNIKFDQVAALGSTDSAHFLGVRRGARPVIVGGSTHEPEEAVLLDAVNALSAAYPDLLLILVPRHPERFSTVVKLLEQRQLRFIQSSQNTHISDDCQVVIVDEMGRLNDVYQVATMAFVGGSLADRGGHNALEPAAASLPVIMGPHTYNNPTICGYLEEVGALHIAADGKAVAAQCRQWLASPALATQAGKAGRQVLDDNRGALAKTLAVLHRFLAPSR